MAFLHFDLTVLCYLKCLSEMNGMEKRMVVWMGLVRCKDKRGSVETRRGGFFFLSKWHEGIDGRNKNV